MFRSTRQPQAHTYAPSRAGEPTRLSSTRAGREGRSQLGQVTGTVGSRVASWASGVEMRLLKAGTAAGEDHLISWQA